MNASSIPPGSDRPQFLKLTPQELAARKRRNLALAAALVGFIVLVFLVTVLNLQRNIAAGRDAALAVPPGPAPATAPAAAGMAPLPASEARP